MRRSPTAVARLLLLAVGLLLAAAAPAGAQDLASGTASIDHIETDHGTLQILFSVPDVDDAARPDLDSVQVTVNDQPLEATATPASDSAQAVRRTAVLAIDTSKSMRGDRFAQAKVAARAFLDAAPDDLYVGVVGFADDVEVLQKPSRDRAATRAVIDDLSLSLQTRLYEGVRQAVLATGQRGQRSVLVLSDGRDTSDMEIADLTATIDAADVKVDVVALEQEGDALEPLEAIAVAGSGRVLNADDPATLTAVFSSEAEQLARQVLVTAPVPASLSGTEGTVAVSLEAGGHAYTASAFVPLGEAAPAADKPATTAAPKPVAASALAVSRPVMIGGVVAVGLGVLVLLAAAFTGGGARPLTLEERIAAYSRTKDARMAAPSPGGPRATAPQPGVAGQAVGMAQKALASNRGFESALGARLDAAAVHLKPAEWLPIHAGIAILAGVLGLLLSSGGLLLTVLFLVLGIVLPWLWLGIKRSRRLKAFEGQLADVLQLMSGSLSAGLSLAQSVDTVVREGTQPVSGELKRALTETRLGVNIEDALDSVAQRMESSDIHWVEMAIRIQREVGGNLAELLLNVAATLREREYLRRQVKALSAEGRLSAWILGALPPGFVAYLAIANPGYLQPMLDSMLGWIMIGFATVMMAVGAFWLSKMVKVEV
jgi:tight adherence protein B